MFQYEAIISAVTPQSDSVSSVDDSTGIGSWSVFATEGLDMPMSVLVLTRRLTDCLGDSLFSGGASLVVSLVALFTCGRLLALNDTLDDDLLEGISVASAVVALLPRRFTLNDTLDDDLLTGGASASVSVALLPRRFPPNDTLDDDLLTGGASASVLVALLPRRFPP